MTSKRQSGKLDWIETIEVERVDEESLTEQQSITTGAGSATPILRKQQTTSSVDHTSDGDSVSEDLAGIAIMETDNTDTPNDDVAGRRSSELAPTESERRLRHARQRYPQRSHRWKFLLLCLLAAIFLIAIIVGGICGAGKCPNSRETSTNGIEGVESTINNDICARAFGPVTIGGIPLVGSLQDVTTQISVPACNEVNISTNYGRWLPLSTPLFQYSKVATVTK
jgi:hypothetical protein